MNAFRKVLAIAAIALVAPIGVNGQSRTNEWTTIKPGGGTGCAFDTPFEFWVREGDPRRVLLFLQGGGACWSLESCHPLRSIAFDSGIDSTDYRQRRDGIFDRSNAANPFRDYTAIFVPYCTGDFHLGARRATYASDDSLGGVTVNHNGFRNVEAALAYLASRPAPSVVVVVGASAGAIASPLIAAEIARRIPAAAVRQIGDGVAGIRAPQVRSMLAQWGVDSVAASLGAPLASSGDVLAGFYKAAAARQPRIRFSQVSTTGDAVVSMWLDRFGVGGSKLPSNIRETHDELRGVCFTGYTLPGPLHTLLWRPELEIPNVADERLLTVLGRDVVAKPCPSAPPSSRDAAFLFAYRAKPGQDAAFAQGYRRHLGWHEAHADSLSWLAWTVIDGPAIGLFVDGTFGIAFKAFDDRVDPADDGADGARNVTAYADPVWRDAYRLRRDLSRASPLEDGRPGRMQKVLRVTLAPDGTRAFEAALRSMRQTNGGRLDYAVYERVSGGEQATYLVVVQLAAWADLENANADPTRALLRAAGAAIARAETETWLYRPELAYFPRGRQ